MGNIGNSSADYSYWRYKPSTYLTRTATGSTIVSVKGSDGILTGLFISPPFTNATVKVWDNVAATGTVLIPTTTVGTGSVVLPETRFTNGLCLTITNTATVTVFYK